jgi:hypothetical protein
MPAEIVWLGLWNRRRSMIDYAVGMALGMLVIVVLYPSFKHSTRARQLTQGNSPLAALLGTPPLVAGCSSRRPRTSCR